ncbi:hypothetical protein FRACYDRAFT_242976 [Fragilariopsis cylindrus CCMP1102]|uniref:Uncharacterized protein n=1 Tax=Fragilariopsis cylindrus CCMP1102 TaxID=635003 RepID=A0A1E7F4Q3_9STRA|nr:hypothetical protein FRACYDRAFT_242976 [Fragilariopsis cylindrus CCMP1102]|eukprot:OEU13162.1 hypothetical protein FRACYDRAFT_242976 [Fragilariopsis cylindrus CCMP1102]
MKLDHFSEREEFYRIRRLSPVTCLLVSALLHVANQIMFASIGEVRVKMLELGVAVFTSSIFDKLLDLKSEEKPNSGVSSLHLRYRNVFVYKVMDTTIGALADSGNFPS